MKRFRRVERSIPQAPASYDEVAMLKGRMMVLLSEVSRPEIILAVCCFLSLPGARAQTVVEEVPAAIGIVFTGGGSFGAFEAGALQAFFDRWVMDHGVAPPVRVIAGTSTGALIGPFRRFGSRRGKRDCRPLPKDSTAGCFRAKSCCYSSFCAFFKVVFLGLQHRSVGSAVKG